MLTIWNMIEPERDQSVEEITANGLCPFICDVIKDYIHYGIGPRLNAMVPHPLSKILFCCCA